MKPRPMDIQVGFAYRNVQPSGKEEVRLVLDIGEGSDAAGQVLTYSVVESQVSDRVGAAFEVTRKAFARYVVSEIAVARASSSRGQGTTFDDDALSRMVECCDRLRTEIRGAIDILDGVLARGAETA